MTSDSLLSGSKGSDSLTQVQLHPLVILTISDYITRHILRQHKGSIVGAIIGAQNGRETTMEHAFECKMVAGKDGETVIDAAWFAARVQQYKDVHKAANLDLVGWFTLAPSTGPESYVLPIHTQLLQNYNESALLLAFHPMSVASATSSSGKLPFTIYESMYEGSLPASNDEDGDDEHMQNTTEQSPQSTLRFKEVPYTIETGDAEMIAVDFVARGGGNASAPQTASTNTTTSGNATAVGPAASTTSPSRSKEKGKTKASETTNGNTEEHNTLSAADEDLIATLTTKANAVRMLRQRLNLLHAYLASIPSDSYLKSSPTAHDITMTPSPAISHGVLRSIASLLARLPLLLPSLSQQSSSHKTPTPLASEAAAERTDVAMTSLLGSMGGTLRAASNMSRTLGVVENARSLKGKGLGVPAGYPSMLDSGADVELEDRGGGGGGGGVGGFGMLNGGGGSSGGGFGGLGGVVGGGSASSNSRPPVDIGALLAGRRG